MSLHKAKNIFAIYAFNKEEILQQALFSIISTLKLNPHLKICLFTDQPNFFQNPLAAFKDQIHFIVLTQDILADWKGSPADNFRVKLKALEYCCIKYLDANILLVDSDTFTVKPLDIIFQKISENNFIMHDYEGQLQDQKTSGQKTLLQFIKNNEFEFANKKFTFPQHLELYNAGVIGLNARHQGLVKEMISLHDVVFAQTKFYFAEQLCVVYFAQQFNIINSHQYIFHYWYIKEFQSKIKYFLSNLPTLNFENIRNLELPISKIPNYQKFKSLCYKIPYKIKRFLYKKGFLNQYVSF